MTDELKDASTMPKSAELAVVAAQPMMPVLSNFSGSIKDTCIRSSINPNTPEGRLALYRATLPGVKAANWPDGKVWLTEHIVMTPADKQNDETGEIESWTRTVLISPDQSRLVFGSGGVAQSIMDLARIFGPPPWKPALPLLVLKLELDGGKRMYKLDVAAGSDFSAT